MVIIMMKELQEKIDRAIDQEAMKTGAMGTEQVRVTLELTDEEVKVFHSMDKYDNEHYFWEFEDNELTITYTEEV